MADGFSAGGLGLSVADAASIAAGVDLKAAGAVSDAGKTAC
jgi:hypothetical protein